MEKDFYFMEKAILLSKKGEFTTSPNPNVGCIIVNKKKIVGKGWHQYAGSDHAEIIALKEAGNKAIHATMYITLEPCTHFGLTPPCCEKIIQSKIYKVVIGSIDPNPHVSGKGIILLQKQGIKVVVGVLEQKIKKINCGFFKRMQKNIPFIRLKLGISLDGKIATKKGESKWITSKESRENVQYFRAKSCAILTSYKTVLLDNPLLTIRKHFFYEKKINNYHKKKQPYKIIIDNKNLVQLEHKCINPNGKVILIKTKKDKKIWPKHVSQHFCPSKEKKNQIDLKKMLYFLGNKKINNILVESGGVLSGMMLQLNLVDELIIYIAPIIIGNEGKSMCVLNNIVHLSESLHFSIVKTDFFGPDIRIIMQPKKQNEY
ncbi:Riboflavin biosynthesis protein RibD [Buchnera aphidicola (Thelaxes suberi)]|uniref:bifunctional diaminohydroxyphosphoribosylaminopyrimidine deaminase/5-amino-6-(5-phosphoribosylamino)uracil reductase RibD n=1 Tax=Buchnera aphidicola TaxID=9 RepID=UPI003464A01A